MRKALSAVSVSLCATLHRSIGAAAVFKRDITRAHSQVPRAVIASRKRSFSVGTFLQASHVASAHYSTVSMSAAPQTSTTALKVALCQMLCGEDKSRNHEAAAGMVNDAAAHGAELVVLPECWNSPYDTSCFPAYAEQVPDGPSTQLLSRLARDNGVWLIGGSIPEVAADKRVYNTCIVFDPTGSIVAKHRKVHLFDIDIPQKITFRESDTLSAGDQVTSFGTPWGEVGVGICYDIRFPELAMLLRQRGAKVIVYPGAFNLTTGPAHWELLQRARAVDNQVFVLTASPARNPESGYQAWGHSSVVDPWGEVKATTDETPGIIYATLDLDRLSEVRDSVPVSFQKRTDIYELVEKVPPSGKGGNL